MIFVPFSAAAVSALLLVVVPQNCATDDGSRLALAMSCQPIAVLPWAATIAWTLLTKVA